MGEAMALFRRLELWPDLVAALMLHPSRRAEAEEIERRAQIDYDLAIAPRGAADWEAEASGPLGKGKGGGASGDGRGVAAPLAERGEARDEGRGDGAANRSALARAEAGGAAARRGSRRNSWH